MLKSKLFVASIILALVLTACGAPTPAPTSVPPTSAPAMTEAPTQAPAMTEAPTQAPTEAATAAPTQPAMSMANIDCMGAQSGDQVTVVYQWTGSEETGFNTAVKPLVDACGIKINAQSTRDPAVLDTMVKSTPPDVLFWPSLSPMKLYADKLMALDTLGGNKDNYPSYWIDMGTANGNWYAVPAKADMKSIIWYSPTQFQAFGYQVPTTFAELQTLVDKMVADGNVPWSMGNNNGGAGNGWVGTDFIQDLLLVSKGPDFVNGIIAGTVPYNDPAVLAAYQQYYKWASDPKYTVGGATGTVNTPFLNAIYDVFDNPPKAMMVRNSGFAGGAIASQFPNLKYPQDYDFFEFPGVQGVQGSADFMYAFSDTPAAKALVAYITSNTGGENWAKSSNGISPNKGASGQYTDPVLSKLSDLLANAPAFTFDIGDALGDPFSTAEFKGVVDIVQGADIKTTLDTVAAAQAATVK
jgi:alpha-glucoside transport system substrate-binding protein